MLDYGRHGVPLKSTIAVFKSTGSVALKSTQFDEIILSATLKSTKNHVLISAGLKSTLICYFKTDKEHRC